MAKPTTMYVCQDCGSESTRKIPPYAACPACGKFGTVVEELRGEAAPTSLSSRGGAKGNSFAGQYVPAKMEQLSEAATTQAKHEPTGLAEFDHVMNGGIVPSSYIVISARPGAGKSTLSTQLLAILRDQGKKVALVAGEESPAQVNMRFERLGLSSHDILVTQDTCIERIYTAFVAEGVDFAVIDSIQTVYSENLTGAAGSVGQVRECADILQKLAKKEGVTVFVVGQVIKDGTLAGPNTFAHAADTNLELEGDDETNLRLLRKKKDRFGPDDTMGIFEMTETGLVGVEDPSGLFVVHRDEPAIGAVSVPVIEGGRPLILEVQALVVPTAHENATPIRNCTGYDRSRFQTLLGVLQGPLRVRLGGKHVYLQIAGGIKVTDPALDLAAALAIVSACENRPPVGSLAAFGEVTLLGEVRRVGQGERRRKELERFDYDTILGPDSVPTLRQAIAEGLGEPVEDDYEDLDD